MAKALGEKIAANWPVMVEREESGTVVLPPPSLGDLGKARLRALYEAANLDIGGARRVLNNLLADNADQIDLFLEIIASERRRTDFSPDELKRRLYKTEENVYTRAHEILAREQPPFQIERMIGALIHLIPGTFRESATELISRYAHSIRDVEEICIGLLSIRTDPPASGKLLGDLRNNGHSAAEKLFSQTHTMLNRFERPDESQMDQAVHSVCELWSELTRSNLYTGGVDELAAKTADPTVSWDWMQTTIGQILDYWYQRISPVVTRVQMSQLWTGLSSNDDRGRLAPLEGLLAQLAQLAKTIPDAGGQRLRIDVDRLTKGLKEQNSEISAHLSRFFVNPVNCIAAQHPNTLFADDGSKINVEVQIDRTVDRVLCDLDKLNVICSELIRNWQKHGAHAGGSRNAWFRLYRDGKFVALEFGDSFGGQFDLDSPGGIRTAKRFCEDYCGILDSYDPDQNGCKALIIQLRLLPGGVRLGE